MERGFSAPVALIVLMMMSAFIGTADAAPVDGEEFRFRQPDGTGVPVRVWGDEFYQRVESLDGYTLVRDADGWIVYAELSDDGNEHVSTGVRYTDNSRAPGVGKGLRISKESVREKRRRAMKELGYDEMLREGPRRHPRHSSSARAGGINPAPAGAEKVVGLTIIVEFPDERLAHTRDEVDQLFNRVGGIEGSNSGGSVYDWYYDVSNGLMEYTNIVAPVITLPNEKLYYDRADRQYVRELITDALNMLNDMNIDLSGVTTDANNRVVALNIFYAGVPEHGWSEGLWPHASTHNGAPTVKGMRFSRYQVTGMGTTDDLFRRLGTLVHENGHMVMGWPDLYNYPDTDGQRHVGSWCVMSNGNSVYPQQPNAYFRHLSGWIDTVDITGTPAGTEFSHAANGPAAYVYRRNAQEAYFIEARRREGIRNRVLPGSGLAIWHVHSGGDNTGRTGGVNFPCVALMQADGRNDLQNGVNNGDITDLFRLGVKTRFNGTTVPAAIYHDGTPSGMALSRISDTGAVMTFKAGDEDYVDEMFPIYRFYDKVMAYARASGNVEAVVDRSFKLDMLIDIPKPKTAGATLTIRSADPAAPAAITRGASGDLFTVPDGAALILENVIIDGGRGDDFEDGGGALAWVNTGGTLAMNGGAVVRNNINKYGGGVRVQGGTFTMTGGEVSGNTASTGGGVWVYGGTFTMAGGKVSGNSSGASGGGMYVSNGAVFTMTGGEISGNSSGTVGGSMYVSTGAVFTMTGGRISGNRDVRGYGSMLVDLEAVFTMNGGVVAGTGRGVTDIVSVYGGKPNLNTGGASSPNNAIIIAWNNSGNGLMLPGTSTDLDVSPPGGAATAVWAFVGGRLGISYAHGTNTGFIDAATLVPISVLSHDRVIPPSVIGDAAVVVPASALTAEFTAGPNPVARSAGAINFYYDYSAPSAPAGAAVIPGRLPLGVTGVLTVYGASGSAVNKIRINDNGTAGGQRATSLQSDGYAIVHSRRQVGSWDLTDKRGRKVADGTYLVRGVITTSAGKRERVSLAVGVR